MYSRILNLGFLPALFALYLLVLTPVLCELDYCCEEEAETECSVECDAVCCAVAVGSVSFDGVPVLDTVARALAVPASLFPQGDLPLPERPPISAC